MTNIEYCTLFSKEQIAGQNQAWELAKKLIASERNGGFSFSQLEEIFGTPDFFKAINENTYLEAAEKVKAWEDSHIIKIGDVVEYDTMLKKYGVVTDIGNEWISGIDGSGSTFVCGIEGVIKTGRTLPVEDWLKQIGEGE